MLDFHPCLQKHNPQRRLVRPLEQGRRSPRRRRPRSRAYLSAEVPASKAFVNFIVPVVPVDHLGTFAFGGFKFIGFGARLPRLTPGTVTGGAILPKVTGPANFLPCRSTEARAGSNLETLSEGDFIWLLLPSFPVQIASGLSSSMTVPYPFPNSLQWLPSRASQVSSSVPA